MFQNSKTRYFTRSTLFLATETVFHMNEPGQLLAYSIRDLLLRVSFGSCFSGRRARSALTVATLGLAVFRRPACSPQTAALCAGALTRQHGPLQWQGGAGARSVRALLRSQPDTKPEAQL